MNPERMQQPQEAPKRPDEKPPQESGVFERDTIVSPPMSPEEHQVHVAQDKEKVRDIRGEVMQVDAKPEEIHESSEKLAAALKVLEDERIKLREQIDQTQDPNQRGVYNKALLEVNSKIQAIELNMPHALRREQAEVKAEYTDPKEFERVNSEYEKMVADVETLTRKPDKTEDDKNVLIALNAEIPNLKAQRDQMKHLIDTQAKKESTEEPKQSTWNKLMGWLGRK